MAGGNTDVKGVREMIGVRASVKWLLTAVAVLSGVSLAAQVLPGEEGILERGRRLPGEVSVEARYGPVRIPLYPRPRHLKKKKEETAK